MPLQDGAIIVLSLEARDNGIEKNSGFAVVKKMVGDNFSMIKTAITVIRTTFTWVYDFFQSPDWFDRIMVEMEKIAVVIKEWLGSMLVFSMHGAYEIGVILFDVIFTVLSAAATGGATAYLAGAKYTAKLVSIFRGIGKFSDDIFSKLLGEIRDVIKEVEKVNTDEAISAIKKRDKLLAKIGCFVKDTPVLMASNANQFSFRNSTKAMAMTAAMPIVAVPIQEVQLLDYAVAHETVNATYGLMASVDDDSYLGLLNKDPYTSDQQRERDEYEINDRDWNEVVFEEVNGSSTAKLALHNDWINKKGYLVDGVVNLDLPEMGISGPFRITSIKHIIPQKKPVDDVEGDEYNYRPVTALFTHESDQVYNIDFDNGESLGVTYQHPIYSVTAGGWKLAGELEIGEQVLAKEGEATVTSSAKKVGQEPVYNLEVQEWHNFLVGESGILVHNSCWRQYLDFLFNPIFNKWTRKNVPNKNWVSYLVESGIPDGKEIKQLEKLGDKLFTRMIGIDKSPKNGANFPGIDGFIEGGNPISLKKAESASTGGSLLSEMVQKANKLNDGLIPDHEDMKGMFNKVDGMLTAKQSEKWWLKQRWQDKLDNGNLNTDIIDKLYIEARDGWMKWDSKTGLWTDM